jgi:CheY-like chemotaxis protein
MARLAWIEDDIDTLLDLRRFLESRHEVHAFRTYEAALAGIDELRQCDLIILDIILPSGDESNRKKNLGLQLVRYLRQQAGVASPILVYSVVANEPNVLRDSVLSELNLDRLDKFSRLATVEDTIQRLLRESTGAR